MTAVYYNEIDPYAAQWLRNLMSGGLIPHGDVDERSIEDVRPDELRGYQQCHFFAGIGGWPHALALAGWPADRPVWTGSCPCQPFSAAGKGAGFADERHLWPAWQHLIAQCRPPVVFGEQVAGKAVEPWVDLVQADMEALDYAFGCIPFPAAGVGAPHIRDRTYWVAHADITGLEGRCVLPERTAQRLTWPGGMAHGVAYSDGDGCETRNRPAKATRHGHSAQSAGGDAGFSGTAPVNGFWRDADWLGCIDGRWRPVEPGAFPLVNGVPSQVGRLRAYGNAIVPQAGAAFIAAFLDYDKAITYNRN